MLKQFRPALVILALLTILTGVIYPLVVTGVSQIVFPSQANGSLIVRDGKPLGSELIGQSFNDPKYFWGRLSATSGMPYNASSSSGSNYGPLNPALLQATQARIDTLKAADPSNTALIPVDLVTASGSGLDPDVSVAAALYQIHRVAQARSLSDEAVRTLVMSHVQGRQFFVFGEPRVNVLLLNLALDNYKP